MARYAEKLKIAGIDFTGCRALVVNGEPFMTRWGGSVAYGNSLKPNVQTFDRTKWQGIKFGVVFDPEAAIEVEKLHELLSTLDVYLNADLNFRVEIEEGIYTDEHEIDVFASPDFGQESWLKKGLQSEGFVEGVELYFVSHGLYDL